MIKCQSYCLFFHGIQFRAAPIVLKSHLSSRQDVRKKEKINGSMLLKFIKSLRQMRYATHILFQTCHTIYMHASYDPYMTSPLSLFSTTIKFCTEVHMMLVYVYQTMKDRLSRGTHLCQIQNKKILLVIKISITMKF